MNTLAAIKKMGMLSTGTYKTKEARDTPLIVEAKGIKFAFLSYTFSVNHHESRVSKAKRGFMVNKLNTAVIAKDIKRARKNGADVVAVMLHWGKEGAAKNNAYQRNAAKAVAKAGADLIIGSHPHVVQGTAIIKSDTPYGKKTCFVAYSMGNFVSGMGASRNRDSLILKFQVKKSAGGKISIGKAQGIAVNISSFKGKRFTPLPYYKAGNFTDSKKVLQVLKGTYSRISKRLDTKRVKMLK